MKIVFISLIKKGYKKVKAVTTQQLQKRKVAPFFLDFNCTLLLRHPYFKLLEYNKYECQMFNSCQL